MVLYCLFSLYIFVLFWHLMQWMKKIENWTFGWANQKSPEIYERHFLSTALMVYQCLNADVSYILFCPSEKTRRHFKETNKYSFIDSNPYITPFRHKSKTLWLCFRLLRCSISSKSHGILLQLQITIGTFYWVLYFYFREFQNL